MAVPRVPEWEPVTVRLNYVTANYFRVLRQPIVQGREPADTEQPEAVVNESVARALATYGPVVGRQIAVGGFLGEVVGVTRDTTDARPDLPPDPQVYVSDSVGIAHVIIRVEGQDPRAIANVQSVVDRLAYPAKGSTVRSLDDERQRANADYHARMWLLLAIAAAGVTVAALGLAGGLYHEVRQQTRSIAIRTALGAGARDIMWGVLRAALGRTAGAAMVGCVGGALVGRAARSLLFGVQGVDVVSIIAVSAILGVLALASSYPAVRQALAIDPARALRQD